MSKVNDYYGKCATCTNYALGSASSMKSGVGFRCSKYGTFKSMNDYCNPHLIMSGYTYNRRVTDSNISSAEKMVTSSNSNCFITTAVIDILHEEYGHVLLNKLKHFRNDVLQQNPAWHPILHNYDNIGPQIADKLRNDPDAFNIADDLLVKYLIHCGALIEYGDDIKKYTEMEDIKNPAYKSAIELYVGMTNWLAQHYNIENRFDHTIVYSAEEAPLMGHGNPEVERGFTRELKRD